MTITRRHHKTLLFLTGALPCLLLALFTNHAWEDWYITYRAGKNLALGNGLVFEPGQVLHTFTSPINVLLPALLSYLLGNQHDDAVLWLYRVISAAFLGGTALLLHRLASREQFARNSLLFLLVLFTIDFKVMDFSINGQEAAFLVFFLALNFVALSERRTAWLGISWAGLMWSRPDSFVYIGASALAFALMSLWRADRPTRRAQAIIWLRLYGKAALITTVLYGPWILWTFWYYGTPVPHTVVAKGLTGHAPLPILLRDLCYLPVDILFTWTAAPYLFMPIYFQFGGWPLWMYWVCRVLAWLAAIAWLFPRMSIATRAASFTVFIGLYYLSYIASFPYPWYFPPVLLAAVISLAGLAQTLRSFATQATWQQLLDGACILVVTVLLCITLMAAWQIRIQQQVIEFGNRKPIGLWLRDHAASPHDTVFLECLGYIGFYSGLKMYDYPGMSSPEMVAARRQYGEDWVVLIRHLQPDWLVLRTIEARKLYLSDPSLLTRDYHNEAIFDQSEALKQYAFLPGRPYLEYDQKFVIFHRQAPRTPPASE